MRPLVDPKWIRGPADRLAIAEGCYFDEALGNYLCDFIEEFCCQSKGRWKAEPIKLLAWQRDWLMRMNGWRRPDGTRRYRRVYVEVAKKNGKSTIVSALTLYFLFADDEGSPEIYLNACSRDQATIVFEEARRMVESSPAFSSRVQVLNSKTDKRLVDPAGNGAIIANSSIASAKDGLNPSLVIFDELHRQPDRQLWAVFEYAGAAREQPLTISITTAGEAAEGPWYEQREYSEKVNAGEIPDIAHLGIVYRCAETDDLDDPDSWRKANPSLGQTIRLEDFQREHAEAKRDAAKWLNFKRLRLNVVASEESKFLDMTLWADPACSAPSVIPKGATVWGGLDLSSTDDLSALVFIAGTAKHGFSVRPFFFLPEDDIVTLERRHKVPYRAWAEAGWITLTPGNVIDYGFIRQTINDFAADHDLRKLLVDPYNATRLAIELAESDGLTVETIRQGFLSLSAPTKELDRLLKAKLIRHGGNPILRWMAGNAVAVADEAGNLKLSKKKSRHKIDGFSALVNAVAGYSSAEDSDESVYERRGLLYL